MGSVVESGVSRVVVFPLPPGCSIGMLVTGWIIDSFTVVAALERFVSAAKVQVKMKWVELPTATSWPWSQRAPELLFEKEKKKGIIITGLR